MVTRQAVVGFLPTRQMAHRPQELLPVLLILMQALAVLILRAFLVVVVKHKRRMSSKSSLLSSISGNWVVMTGSRKVSSQSSTAAVL